MKIGTLIYIADKFKTIQRELKTTELLNGLTLTYELPYDEFVQLQMDIYKLSHPAMDGYREQDLIKIELLGVDFTFKSK
jgi:hypothetical protein